MKKFKLDLSAKLLASVQKIFPDANLIAEQKNERGFFCDFDIRPLNPGLFEEIKQGFDSSGYFCQLDNFSGVYEDGDASRRILQRIYAVAFETQQAMNEYKAKAQEAAARDHKLLGAELDIFSSSNDIGQGLILWHPKGAMVRYLLERFGQEAHILNGYKWVYTPHIGRGQLWETSGHLDFYRDSMYNPIDIDGEEYFLKPMNCPFHIDIYNSHTRSYRELPLRYAEYGTVYRYELSGTLNGLTRVRGFTQDDAHIICTPDQIFYEVKAALEFSLYILRSFGLTDFTAYISTKPKAKFIGEDSQWEKATEVLMSAVKAAGLDYDIDEGGGAFYGPKIDLKLKDALGRQWQCSTIQFDFNLPTRFNMSYVGADGSRHTPMMVHRALFGSIERFTALLIEHYKGDFPFWLSPVQFGVIPIRQAHNPYAANLSRELKQLGFRVSLKDDDANMRSKIKAFETEKVPFVLVIGDREVESQTFSVRARKQGDLGSMSLTQLMEYLQKEIQLGKPRGIFD